MKKNVVKKILSFFLCLVTTISLFPTVSFAEWVENGRQCDICGEWDDESNVCEDCGCHFNNKCEGYTHCQGCDRCFATGDDNFCTDCGYCYNCAPHCVFCGECPENTGDVCEDCDVCENCALELGSHCAECGTCLSSGDECAEHGNCCGHCKICAEDWTCNECNRCFYENQDDFCETCNMCLDCAVKDMYHCGYCNECCDGDVVCEYCGKCDNCALSDGNHCPNCEKCFEGETEACAEGGDHCIDCCYEEGWICSECGECAEGKGIDICTECGLCEDCCFENSQNGGCSSGEICVGSTEWDEHFCPECEKCFCDADKCEYCGLCENCCYENSVKDGCSSGDVCVESPEWEHHFCEECSDCFCISDYCDYCGLCIICCQGYSECSEEMCAEDPDYDEHFCSECGKCFHEEDQCDACADRGILICLDCCDNDEHTEAFVNEAAPTILRQPSDFRGVISDPDGADNHANFLVKVKDETGVTYQWQEKINGSWENVSDNITDDTNYYTKGSSKAELSTKISASFCVEEPKVFRCVITNAYGSVNTKEVKIYAEHLYKKAPVDAKYHQLKCVSDSGDYHYKGDKEKHTFGEWTTTSAPTASSTGLKVRTCIDCGYEASEVIPSTHEHNWSTGWYTADPQSHWYYCFDCGITAAKDKAPHTYDGTITVVTEPTEMTTGSGYKECTVCGHRENVSIPKIAHVHDFLKDSNASRTYGDTEGTYTYGGYSRYNSYDDAYHWKLCKECVKENGDGTCKGYVYEKVPHDYLEWHVDSENNKMSRVCHVCGYIQEKSIPEHDSNQILITATNGKVSVNSGAFGDYVYAKPGDRLTFKASEKLDGGDFDKWSNATIGIYCNGSYYSNGDLFGTGDKNIIKTGVPFTDTVVSFELPNPEEWSYTDADSKEWKFKYLELLNMMATYNACSHSNAALDNSTSHAATCTVSGCTAATVCPDCHAIVTPSDPVSATGHNYILDSSTAVLATCEDFGYEGDYVCSNCGDVKKGKKLEKLSHAYGDEKVLDAATCHSNGHKGKECSVCGDVIITETLSRTNHVESDWKKDAYGHWKECTLDGCGTILVNKASHYDADKDGLCDNCGYNVTKYSITYTDGVSGAEIFADKVFNAVIGAETPSFGEDPVREGYTFKGWSPAVSLTVNGNVTYTAVWGSNSPVPPSEPAGDTPSPLSAKDTVLSDTKTTVPSYTKVTPLTKSETDASLKETEADDETIDLSEEKIDDNNSDELIENNGVEENDKNEKEKDIPTSTILPGEVPSQRGGLLSNPWVWITLGCLLAVTVVIGAIYISKKNSTEE